MFVDNVENGVDSGWVNSGRRKFLWQTAVLGLGAAPLLSEKANASGFDRDNAFAVLKNFSFKDQDGKPINGADLKNMVGGSDFTVSLSLNSCATGVCTPENSNLAKIASAFPQLKHIVINANPEVEAIDQQARDAYAETIAHGKIPKENLIVLYPPSNAEVQKISSNLGNVTLMGKEHESHHSSVIARYDSTGAFKAEILAHLTRNNGEICAFGNVGNNNAGKCR